MKIQLKSTRAIYINLTPKEDNESSDDFSFDYEIDFPKESDSFLVAIKAIFKQLDYELDVVYLAEFTTDSDLDEDFKKSKFPYVNAPAIAYPFFRSFVAHLLSAYTVPPPLMLTIGRVAKGGATCVYTICNNPSHAFPALRHSLS